MTCSSSSMAGTLSDIGWHGEAARLFVHVIEVKERSSSRESTLHTRMRLGIEYVHLGRHSEAIPLLRDSLAAYDGMGLGPEHPQLALIPEYYGKALLGAGQAAASVPMFQRHIAFRERMFGPHHYLIPGSLIHMAQAYGLMGRGFDERLPLLDRAVAIFELSVGKVKDSKEHTGVIGFTLKACAEGYEEAGRLIEAETRWAKCVAAFTKVSICICVPGPGPSPNSFYFYRLALS